MTAATTSPGCRGQEWDAVFDTFTDTEPGAPAVRATAELLSGAVGAYGYVSGMSVYAPSGPSRPDESGPVRQAGVEPDTRPAAGTLAGQAGGRGGGDRAVRRPGAVPAGRHHGRAAVDPLHLLAGADRRRGDGPAAAVDPGAGGPAPQRPVLRCPRHRRLVHLDARGRPRRHLQHGRSRPAGQPVVGDRGVLRRRGGRAGRPRLRRRDRRGPAAGPADARSTRRSGRSGIPRTRSRRRPSTRRPRRPRACGSARRR